MPVETVIIKPGKLYQHIIDGFIVLEDVKKQLGEFWQNSSDYENIVNIIWDLRNADLGTLSFEDIDYLANHLSQSETLNFKPGRTAVLVDDNPTKHLASYLVILLANLSVREIKLFHSYDEALAFTDNS